VRAAVAALRNATRAGGRTRNEHSIAAAIFDGGIEGRHGLNDARACDQRPRSSVGTSGMGRRSPCNPEQTSPFRHGIRIVRGSLAGADQLVMR